MSAVTLDQVQNQIARGFSLLRFTPQIEALFRADYAEARLRLIANWGVVGVAIYDLVYFGDRIMVADVLPALMVVRFLIFTPLVIACVLIVRRFRHPSLYDALAVVVAFLGVTLPMAAAVNSQSSYLFTYQNYNAAAFLFFVISLRPRFPALLIGLSLMCASHFTLTYLTGAFDDVVYTGIVTFYLTLSVFLAVSAYFLERTDRQNFLNQLRSDILYQQMKENAGRDALTGLMNRRSLALISERIWKDADRTSLVSAVLLDIDHFKRYNDVHGHIEGDACIRAVSQCIADTADAGCSVFRFGGEEILVLAQNRDELAMLALAEKIRSAIERLGLRHGGLPGTNGEGRVTASLGVTSASIGETTLEKLLQTADEALYEAKRRGRNIVALYDTPEPDVQVA
ncbi:MAG: GGDEF domain-containing protein [Neorhizobium sp.]|nr:GGDEF domain-containing protein [Neorhizobium sp.]